MREVRNIVKDELDRILSKDDIGAIGIPLDKLSEDAQDAVYGYKTAGGEGYLGKRSVKILKELIAYVKKYELYDSYDGSTDDIRDIAIYRGISLKWENLSSVFNNKKIGLRKRPSESWTHDAAYAVDWMTDSVRLALRNFGAVLHRYSLRGNVIWNYLSEGGKGPEIDRNIYPYAEEPEILLPNQCTACKGSDIPYLIFNKEDWSDFLDDFQEGEFPKWKPHKGMESRVQSKDWKIFKNNRYGYSDSIVLELEHHRKEFWTILDDQDLTGI